MKSGVQLNLRARESQRILIDAAAEILHKSRTDFILEMACKAAEDVISDLLRAAFPGGSITGAPKVRAMEIIDELEPQRRNAWCGSIGYLSFCGNMDTSITIRTLTAINGQIYCSAGGGIVADSQEEAEYQETFDKVNKILRQLEK